MLIYHWKDMIFWRLYNNTLSKILIENPNQGWSHFLIMFGIVWISYSLSKWRCEPMVYSSHTKMPGRPPYVFAYFIATGFLCTFCSWHLSMFQETYLFLWLSVLSCFFLRLVSVRIPLLGTLSPYLWSCSLFLNDHLGPPQLCWLLYLE
jgi:hypothetical protein